MNIAVLGIDLGKNTCSVVGLDEPGRVVLRRRMQRKTILSFAANLSPCIIAMEACCGAHHLGRILAAQGLVPRQATTGGKPCLLGITKRGSKYLRKMLIQGARAALPTLSRSNTRLGKWLRGLLARAHANTVVVALAAKMARIVWALLRHNRTFEQRAIAV